MVWREDSLNRAPKTREWRAARSVVLRKQTLGAPVPFRLRGSWHFCPTHCNSHEMPRSLNLSLTNKFSSCALFGNSIIQILQGFKFNVRNTLFSVKKTVTFIDGAQPTCASLLSSRLSGGAMRVSRSIHALLEKCALSEVKLSSLALLPRRLEIKPASDFSSWGIFLMSVAQICSSRCAKKQHGVPGCSHRWWRVTLSPTHCEYLCGGDVTPPLDVKVPPMGGCDHLSTRPVRRSLVRKYTSVD